MPEAPPPTAPPASAPPPSAPATPALTQPEKEQLTEGSIIGRVVAIITPILAVVASEISGWTAKNLGAELNKEELVALMITVVTAVLVAGWKWLDGLQKHEQRVSEGKAAAIKKPRSTQDARQHIL